MTHTEIVDSRCEDMLSAGLLKETAELYLSGKLPEQGQQARAIGYRQTLGYLKRKNFSPKDNMAFEAYLDEFKTATRRYAKKQMQWFRKDETFIFIPVPLTEPSETRVDTVANYIKNFCTMARTDFDKELSPGGQEKNKKKKEGDMNLENMSLSTRIKYVNEQQGKSMKFYQSKPHKLVEGSHEYDEVLNEADICTSQILSKTF
jgi:tRNA delta(2)-isopentenylpyrophosphate transferase